MKTKLYLDFDGVINAWEAHKVWDEATIRKGVAGAELAQNWIDNNKG